MLGCEQNVKAYFAMPTAQPDLVIDGIPLTKVNLLALSRLRTQSRLYVRLCANGSSSCMAGRQSHIVWNRHNDLNRHMPI